MIVALMLMLGVTLGAGAGAEPVRVDAHASTISAAVEARDDAPGRLVGLTLALSAAVPYRVRLLDAPRRLVLDLDAVDWAGFAPGPVPWVAGQRMGQLPDGWARLVLDLDGPYLPVRTEQRIDPATGAAEIALRLAPVTPAEFTAAAHDAQALIARSDAAFLLPAVAAPPAPARRESDPAPVRRPLVMLDPGHGGIDPGAERDGVREADLVLDFARLLRAELDARGQFDVAMTREADVFVSLDARIRAARVAGADLLVSLHADALPEGMASGTVVYTLAEEASDASAQYLAGRHARADLLAGVDLTRNTDEIARVLMSVTWQDTAPRARALAQALVDGVGQAGLRLHRRPVQSGAFTVLRASDIPSVLIELGFMSSPRDLADLIDPAWQAQMAAVLAEALEEWLTEDREMQALRRR